MNNNDNGKWKRTLKLLIFIPILFSPILLQMNIFNFGTFLKNSVRVGDFGNWLGFWGSYLGSVIAVFFAFINTKVQLKESQRNDYKKAIILNELNTTIKILQAGIYIENQIHALKTELGNYQIKTYYLELNYDYLPKTVEIWNKYNKMYNDNILIYGRRVPRDIVKKGKSLEEYYKEVFKTSLFSEIKDIIQSELERSKYNKINPKKISSDHKKQIQEIYPKVEKLYEKCQDYLNTIYSFYEYQENEITS